MDQLKRYLITRLLLVTGFVIATEFIFMMPVRFVILPVAAGISSYENATGSFSFNDIISILGNLFFGKNPNLVIGLAARSKVLLLLFLSAILFLIPLAAGILFYTRLVTVKVNELQKARDAEREAYDKQRNLMLSDFAHDLRTPITTIAGYAQALDDGVVKDPAMQKEYLQAIHRKAGRMAELITLLFDYVKLGSTGFSLNKKPCDLNALVAEVTASLYTDIEEAGDELLADIPETAFTVEADRAQAGRVLHNLIINAVRHNPSGTVISVSVRRLAGVELVAVADSGVKIEKTAGDLFDPFVKGDDSRSGDKGSGLGLSISKKIADMHGWELTLVQPYGSFTKAFVIKVPEL